MHRFGASRFEKLVGGIVSIAALVLVLNLWTPLKNMLDPVLGNKLYLGLDLRGGSHLVLGVDKKPVLAKHFESVQEILRADYDIKNTSIIQRQPNIVGDDDFGVVFVKTASVIDEEVYQKIKSGTLFHQGYYITKNADDSLVIAMTVDKEKEVLGGAIDQTIEVIRNRIDQSGTNEPLIQRQGSERILVQLPGIEEPDRIKKLIGRTARLSVHLAKSPRPVSAAGKKSTGSKLFVLDYKDPSIGYFVDKKAVIGGENILKSSLGFDQNNRPAVDILLDKKGARKFSLVTRRYQTSGPPKRYLAIILDDQLISVPSIGDHIPNGRVQIVGQFTSEEAGDLALLLRAGALPAPLTFLEERTVGPSLGSDSIEAGKIACIIGFVIVIIFMAVTYGVFGLFANVALLINLVLMFAMLSVLQATLTLPGIAGIVLTLGMAVDANILIFARIREEYLKKPELNQALFHGFNKAFSTIMDANITTFIAAFVLFLVGSGPVKGFAVTLSIGLLTSMFSALIITKIMVTYWFDYVGHQGSSNGKKKGTKKDKIILPIVSQEMLDASLKKGK